MATLDLSAVNPRTADIPLVVHIIYRLDVGGLENGLVNLINGIAPERFRHAIICLTDYSDFRHRIQRADVPVFALNKPPGNSASTQIKLWRLLRRLRPDIVHTRNLAALECLVAASLAGTAVRIHGEHGRDVDDLDGRNVGRQRVRRLFKPFVHQYVTVSLDLATYLREKVGVPAARITQIYNGANTDLFHPARDGREPPAGMKADNEDVFVIGSVGRMQPVKDPLNLVKAFILLLQMLPASKKRLRLAMVGDGPLRRDALDLLAQAGVLDAAWLPGNRDDIPALMRGFDLFVLPSLAEGISNTLLEAMASGLPSVVTRVGGNAELVAEGTSATIVPPANAEALAGALREYVLNPEMAIRHGRAARKIAERRFGLDVMVKNYAELYDRAWATRSRAFARETVGASRG